MCYLFWHILEYLVDVQAIFAGTIPKVLVLFLIFLCFQRLLAWLFNSRQFVVFQCEMTIFKVETYMPSPSAIYVWGAFGAVYWFLL